MAVYISRKEDYLTVKFDYSPKRAAKVKSLKGSRWDASNKMWLVPYDVETLRLCSKLKGV